VNARLSARSFARWRRRPGIATPLFGTIGLVLAQSTLQAERFAALGAPHVQATGNVKFDAPPPAPDRDEVRRLAAALAGRPVWLAASTHHGEEKAVLTAHRTAAARLPQLVTILAPRHPERAARIARLAARTGRTTRRSRGEGPDGAIFLVDTFGELATFLALAPVVFLGGSLVPLGGHNPAEPAAGGAALLTGPDHGEMFEPFVASGAARVVPDGRALGEALAGLLADAAACRAMGAQAAATLAAERGALERSVAGLEGWLHAAAGKAAA
jgi:3-deoxy-D-manno-octulosonic-acid transferase